MVADILTKGVFFYMATGYDKTATAQAMGISKGELEARAKAGGYSNTEDYASSIGKNVGSSSGSSNSSIIQNAIKMNQQAIQPAVQSYQAQIPEISKGYSQQRDTLSSKYDALLASIKGNQTTGVNRQTVVTANELGKRGISGDSTLAGQEIANAIQPIEADYAGLMSNAGLSKIGDINQTYTDETAAQRAVTNAIAQLQANAGMSGVSQGYTSQQNAAALAQNQSQFNATSAATQKQRDIENKLAEITTKYATGKPYYSPSQTPGGALDIQGLYDQFSKSGGM
jgi:hypothetical protein